MKINKYKNKKTTYNGIVFDSKKELQRYMNLLEFEKFGLITNLQLQPKFILQDKFIKNGKAFRKIEYIADFSYTLVETNKIIVEDVKSKFTASNPVYKLKKKMFEYKYRDLEINEIIC